MGGEGVGWGHCPPRSRTEARVPGRRRRQRTRAASGHPQYARKTREPRGHTGWVGVGSLAQENSRPMGWGTGGGSPPSQTVGSPAGLAKGSYGLGGGWGPGAGEQQAHGLGHRWGAPLPSQTAGSPAGLASTMAIRVLLSRGATPCHQATATEPQAHFTAPGPQQQTTSPTVEAPQSHACAPPAPPAPDPAPLPSCRPVDALVPAGDES